MVLEPCCGIDGDRSSPAGALFSMAPPDAPAAPFSMVVCADAAAKPKASDEMATADNNFVLMMVSSNWSHPCAPNTSGGGVFRLEGAEGEEAAV
jgi:hypothetical protein